METPQDNDQDPTRLAIERVTETMAGGIGAAAVAAPGNETVSRDTELIDRLSVADLHFLIERRLIDTDMPGTATGKYEVDGHPSLLVRQTRGAKLHDTAQAMYAARILDIPMAPWRIVKHKEQIYHITERITGEALDALLQDTPAGTTRSDELLAATDLTWEKMVRALMRAFREDIPWPEDIEGPNQFMRGTRPGETEAGIWLVDLPARSNKLEGDAYGDELIFMTSAVYEIEQGLGRRAEKTRAAFAEAIALCPDSETYGDGLRNTVRYCLENKLDFYGLRIDYDDFVNQRRTR